MVSKVAVIAIVGIVAIPILLGFGLNLNEVTETEYKPSGEAINVTPLLQNGATYTLAHADAYTLNTNFNAGLSLEYENVGNVVTTYYSDSQSGWVDFSSGFHFNTYALWGYTVLLPELTKSVLFTINLDTLPEANYTIKISSGAIVNDVSFIKETIDGEVKWKITGHNGTQEQDLYYDKSVSDNSYQIYLTRSEVSGPNENGRYDATYTWNIRYVGSWPQLIGSANYYLDYQITNSTNTLLSETSALDYVFFGGGTAGSGLSSRSFTIRMDDALFNAMEYPIIKNRTYAPADFRTNPSTSINNVKMFGNSIVFAGNTYNVGSDGNIMLGTHKVSVNGMVLDTIPTETGYKNRINGITINETVDPSTITFNGQWSANISTIAQDATTYTKTNWVAGQFAWDGMDTSFLMVGLITSLGMFIALGIYARRSRASVWPLMLVCGGAAALFFIML